MTNELAASGRQEAPLSARSDTNISLILLHEVAVFPIFFLYLHLFLVWYHQFGVKYS